MAIQSEALQSLIGDLPLDEQVAALQKMRMGAILSIVDAKLGRDQLIGDMPGMLEMTSNELLGLVGDDEFERCNKRLTKVVTSLYAEKGINIKLDFGRRIPSSSETSGEPPGEMPF